jgi:hypothetical protein
MRFAMRRAGLVLFALFALLALPTVTAWAGSPFALCRRLGTSDRLRPLPPALVEKATELFGLSAMPKEQIRRSTVFRCRGGHVLLCNVGANLACGKANTARHLAAADQWCAGHPGSGFIPMYVTRHDTIYRWRCAASHAVTIGRPSRVDRRGFIARLWKRAD